jgi:nucleoside triphosphate diphosphatase
VAAVPVALPSLQRAARIGEKAASWGFDWPDAEQVLEKVREEIAELEADKTHPVKAREELGDLFFALAQYARKMKWDPEEVTAEANRKFLGRFEALEKEVEREGLQWEKLSLQELEERWQRVKKAPVSVGT